MSLEKTKLAISLVTYNGEKYLPFCLKSISEQTFKDFSFLVIDNGSNDNTVRYFKENYPQIKVVEHKKNVGFAKAHNQAISWTNSDYICLLNQDTILEPDYFKKAIAFLDENSEVAALSGKIFRWDFANNQKTEVIDSLGLRLFKSHRAIEIGQGGKESVNQDESREVFGVSGALPLYRRSALEQVTIKGPLGAEEYFDELFFSYKEDVDLAWRLRLAGFKAYFLSSAIAYHDRTVKGQKDLSDKATIRARRDRDKMVKIFSYKNHCQTIIKNEFLTNFIKYFGPIFWYEFKKFVYIIFLEQSTLRGLKLFFQERKKILKKRKYIIKNIRKVKAKELAKWYE